MEDGSGSVGDGEFVVAGRDAAPLLDQCERPLDDVAVFVGVFVERRPAAALGAFVFADGDLITLLALGTLSRGQGVRPPAARSIRSR